MSPRGALDRGRTVNVGGEFLSEIIGNELSVFINAEMRSVVIRRGRSVEADFSGMPLILRGLLPIDEDFPNSLRGSEAGSKHREIIAGIAAAKNGDFVDVRENIDKASSVQRFDLLNRLGDLIRRGGIGKRRQIWFP